MNNALTRSAVPSNNYTTSVGLISLNTDFYGQCNEDIMRNEMMVRHGFFSNIDQEMIAYGADLAFLITGDDSATGCKDGYTGRVFGVAAIHNSIFPFAITPQAYTIDTLTALHEIGHNLGGKHSNRFNSPLPARGYTLIFNNRPKQTIMGSYDTNPCNFTGLSSNCERTNHFSNPNVNFPRPSLVGNNNLQVQIVETWHFILIFCTCHQYLHGEVHLARHQTNQIRLFLSMKIVLV